VDHIKPVRRYPHLRPKFSNLGVLCNDCNMGKGSNCTRDWGPVLAKHANNCSIVDVLALGVDRISGDFEPLRREVESWQSSQISDEEAKLVIYRAFIENHLDIPRHLARALGAITGFGRSVMAHLHRSHDGQALESGFVPM
jgi:hypothetical protein